MNFLYYKPNYIAQYRDLPGISKFCSCFKIYSPWGLPVDRTGALKIPVRVKSLFPVPRMRVFTKNYEDLCNERAKEFLGRAERLDTLLYVFWSGGVDSTCLLVSLLKAATKAQKERIVILMSEESISEYPFFYYKYIRGNLRRESAMMFPYLLGTKNLFITGEHNDQIFGSDVVGILSKRFGQDVIHQPYDNNLFAKFFGGLLKGDECSVADVLLYLEKLCAKAPIPLTTNFDYFWWINFALKWQPCFMRVLGHSANDLSATYVKNYYATFYNTEPFQLWAMNNMDLRIGQSWRSYKWPAKDVIYGFTKDEVYRDTKVKRGSLIFLVGQHVERNFIDEKFGFHERIEPSEFYLEDNDFR